MLGTDYFKEPQEVKQRALKKSVWEKNMVAFFKIEQTFGDAGKEQAEDSGRKEKTREHAN